MIRNIKRDKVVKKLADIAFGKSNDVLKLVICDPESILSELDQLDLTMLSEIKKAANGVIEIKLIDRLKALEALLKVTDSYDHVPENENKTDAFIRAIENAAMENGRRDAVED